MNSCVVQRPRRPQLSDTINRLDEMIETLATAIPGAVAESVKEVLGTSLASSIRDTVREAVKEGVKEAVQAAVGEAVTAVASARVPTGSNLATRQSSPEGALETRVGAWARLKAALGALRRWTARRVAPVALGWAIVKVVGGSTVRSRWAALATALTGAIAGVAGYFAGPIGSAILLALAGGSITATAAFAAPAVRLLVAIRND